MMKKRNRVLDAFAGLLMIVSILLIWFTHDLLLRNFGLILWIGVIIYLMITTLRGSSRRNR